MTCPLGSMVVTGRIMFNITYRDMIGLWKIYTYQVTAAPWPQKLTTRFNNGLFNNWIGLQPDDTNNVEYGDFTWTGFLRECTPYTPCIIGICVPCIHIHGTHIGRYLKTPEPETCWIAVDQLTVSCKWNYIP